MGYGYGFYGAQAAAVSGGSVDAISASNGFIQAATITFGNSNSVSFMVSGGSIVASFSQSFQPVGSFGVSNLGNTIGNTGTVANQMVLAGGNNITLSQATNTDGITVTISAPNQTNQTLGLYAASNTTINSSTILDARSLTVQGAGIISVGYSNGSMILSAVNDGTGAAIKGSGTYTQGTGTIEFANSNGLTFGLSNNGVMTASVNGITISAGTNSRSTGLVQFIDDYGITFGLAANGKISASHNGITSQTNQNISLYGLGNTTQNSSTVLNASNLSFNAIGSLTVGYSNGSIQFSAPNALTTAMASNRGSDFVQASATFAGTNASGTIASNGISVSVDAGVPSPINFSAGTTSANLSNVVFGDANGISFGLNGSTITATIQPKQMQLWDNMPYGNTISGGAGSFAFTNSHRSLFVFPLIGDIEANLPANITGNTIFMNASISGSAATNSSAFSSTFFLGIYTMNGSTLSLLNSGSFTMGTNAGNANLSQINHGQRFVPMVSSAWSSQPIFYEGSMYWAAFFWSSAGVLNQTGNLLGYFKYSTLQRQGSMGVSATANTSQGWYPYYGIYTATTNAFPNGILPSELNKVNAAAGFIPHIVINQNATASF